MDNNMLIYENEKIFGLRKILLMICCLALPLGVGMLSAYLTKSNMMVFDYIKKPMLTPPSIVFPIAWTILYILMGLASYFAIIECKESNQAIYVMYPYIIQLILNFMWSIIFFNYQRYDIAFVVLIFMWIMVLRTMIFFGTLNQINYYLLTPYLLWTSFAGYLNLMIVVLNPR